MAVAHIVTIESGWVSSSTWCGVVWNLLSGDRLIYWPEESAEKVTCPGCAAALAQQALTTSGEC